MNPIAKQVRDEWNSSYQRLPFDTDVLTTCVMNLTQDETDIIRHKSPEASYRFLLMKLRRRYDDVMEGATKYNVNSEELVFTGKSSIIELCPNTETYAECIEHGIKMINDVRDGDVSTITPTAMAELFVGNLLVNVEK